MGKEREILNRGKFSGHTGLQKQIVVDCEKRTNWLKRYRISRRDFETEHLNAYTTQTQFLCNSRSQNIGGVETGSMYLQYVQGIQPYRLTLENLPMYLLTLHVQWGLEYRTCLDFGWSTVFGSWSRPFENRTLASLGRFTYKHFLLYI